MDMNRHKNIFNNIATVYDWFFRWQHKHYVEDLESKKKKKKIPLKGKVLDLGCGTGALTMAFKDLGFDVTGVDLAEGMVKKGRKRGLNCLCDNVLDGLGFDDNSFDLVTAAHVVHGLDREKRLKLYNEAARLTSGIVLFSDYSSRRRWPVTVIEYLEGGDYFNFINKGAQEMSSFFSNLEIIPMGPNTNWYLCTL